MSLTGVRLRSFLHRYLPSALLRPGNGARVGERRDCARAGLAGQKKLHLGCGDHLLPGWANIDQAGAPGSIRYDLTSPWPIDSQAVRLIFSEHFLEHITRTQGRTLVLECHRVLAPGGILRVSTPNLRKIAEQYMAERTTEWVDVGWFPLTPCQMMNEGLRDWGHQFVYDAPELESLLRECGFSSVARVAWRESSIEDLRGLECRPFHDDLIFEATK